MLRYTYKPIHKNNLQHNLLKYLLKTQCPVKFYIKKEKTARSLLSIKGQNYSPKQEKSS